MYAVIPELFLQLCTLILFICLSVEIWFCFQRIYVHPCYVSLEPVLNSTLSYLRITYLDDLLLGGAQRLLQRILHLHLL